MEFNRGIAGLATKLLRIPVAYRNAYAAVPVEMAAFLPRLPGSVFDATMALPYHLFVISTQVPEMPVKIQYGTALVLLAFVLGMNVVATVIRSRARARRQW